ncbi:hypothetical protein [Stenotrophomonas maltophilia]|uniref:hypothetical protein n=1 Tax=Stenotrophomonas maltophilia TaxID=40324 RepID=UPI0015DD973D|nr:hypothetical protein [Stenotrophomonas maltophilia]MBA0448691.1 hypothetical protein [Stenotrophomonas maltophilia]
MKNTLLAFALLALASCANHTDSAVITQAGAQVSAAGQSGNPIIAVENLDQLSSVVMESAVQADISLMQANALMRKERLTPGPASLADFALLAQDRRKDIAKKYAVAIRTLPESDLRAAMKEDFSAQMAYYENFRMVHMDGSPQWQEGVVHAKQRLTETAGRVRVEMELAAP